MQVSSSNVSLQNRYFLGTGSIGGIHLPDFNDKYVFSKKKSGISDEEYTPLSLIIFIQPLCRSEPHPLPCNKSERFISLITYIRTSPPGRPQRQSIMRLRGIGCNDYICISTDDSELLDFFKFASTDSLVMPSKAPGLMGFPAFHAGSAAFAAAINACV